MTKAAVVSHDYTSEDFLNAAQQFADKWGLRVATNKFLSITNRPVIEREAKSGVRGRRPKYETEEERQAAIKASRRNTYLRNKEALAIGRQVLTQQAASE